MNDEQKRLEALIPESFYGDLSFKQRLKFLVDGWRRAIEVNQKLEADVESLNTRLHVVEHLRDALQAKLEEWHMECLGERSRVETERKHAEAAKAELAQEKRVAFVAYAKMKAEATMEKEIRQELAEQRDHLEVEVERLSKLVADYARYIDE